MKTLIYGLFGTTNFGDELFSKVVAGAVNRHPKLSTPYLITTNPKESARNVENAEFITGYPLPKAGFGAWRNTLTAYQKASGLFFGGGGLFNEVFLRAGIPAHGLIVATAKVFNVPYVIHGVELGYVGSATNKWITGWSLRNAYRVLCRNQQSVDRARDVYGVDIELGLDLNHAWLHEQMSKEKPAPAGRPRFVVNLQHSLDTEDQLIDDILGAKRAEGFEIIYVANDPEEAGQFRARFSDAADEVIAPNTVDALTAQWRTGDAFLTERFHFTMAALHADAPTTVIVSSSKVRDLVCKIRQSGAGVKTLREEEGSRAVYELAPSSERRDTVGNWAARSRRQLEGVVDDIATERAAKKGGAGTLLIVFAFSVILIGNYVLDKFSPLNRHLDTSKT